jgi:glycosyltransferase involved in cell wall biosynthesis
MKILYGYSTCSDKKYKELMQDVPVMVLQQDQKYHSLLTNGLRDCGNDCILISGLPINRDVTKKIFIKEKDEEIDNIKYHYFSTINLPILRQLGIMIKSYFYTKRFLKKNPDAVIIIDVLFSSISTGILKASKKFKNKKIGIVTDIPPYFDESQIGTRAYKQFEFIIDNLDGYLLLTDAMKDIVNKNKKPYIVIEGQADKNMAIAENLLENKYPKKTVMYAGMLHKKYGIKTLVDAFIKADIKDAELHIYGDGDYKDEIIDIAKSNPNIKYMGFKPNEKIVEEELKATLLVNPRPSDLEFTKYSFPSKNMEYMASGTPLLCTKLPGMPKEYFDYIYTADDESADGFADKLKEILNKDKEELHNFGLRAKKFVLEEKNNQKQAEKLTDFIKSI